MTRNIWWLVVGVLALTVAGGAHAEEEGGCAQKCPKACATKACQTVTVAAECTCEGKDKENCKCAKCKCEAKPETKCPCEGKDKDKCICEKCKCMKKVSKIVTLGKEGVLILRWLVGSPATTMGCCETKVAHNEGAECAEAGCCAGCCPLKTATKHNRVVFGIGVHCQGGVNGCTVLQGNQVLHPVVVHGPLPIPVPLFPAPVPPAVVNPFVLPLPNPTVAVPTSPRYPVTVSAQSMMPYAPVAMPSPVVPAIRFVADGSQVKMEMQHGDSCVASDRMKLQVGDGCTVQVGAENGQIALRCECMNARADRVIKTGKGDRIVLEGNVAFKYSKGEQVVEATAERVVIDPSTGHFEIKTSE